MFRWPTSLHTALPNSVLLVIVKHLCINFCCQILKEKNLAQHLDRHGLRKRDAPRREGDRVVAGGQVGGDGAVHGGGVDAGCLLWGLGVDGWGFGVWGLGNRPRPRRSASRPRTTAPVLAFVVEGLGFEVLGSGLRI